MKRYIFMLKFYHFIALMSMKFSRKRSILFVFHKIHPLFLCNLYETFHIFIEFLFTYTAYYYIIVS